MRWRNPKTGLLFLVQLFAAGPSKMFIDGKEPASGRPLIPFGDHVISIAIDGLIPGSAAMAFAVGGICGAGVVGTALIKFREAIEI